MKSLRAYLAAAAIAIAGLAGAGAASANPVLGPNKLTIRFCIPHVETHTKYVGIVKIGYTYYRVYLVYKVYVNRYCQKRVISVTRKLVPLFHFPLRKPAGV